MKARSSSRANMARCTSDGAFEIITFEGGFHGRTLATMSASRQEGVRAAVRAARSPGFRKATLNDLASVEAADHRQHRRRHAGADPGRRRRAGRDGQFLQELRALTTKHDLLLIFDEIQTGMGRTGKLFAYEHAGIAPDIMTLGKGIGGGVPLAALLATSEVACFEHGDQGGTFNGNPLMCAASAVLPGERRDGNPRRVRADDRPGASRRVNLLEQRSLDVELLDDRFDDPVALLDARELVEAAVSKSASTCRA